MDHSAVAEFCYLGDSLSAGGGCEIAAITRCKSAWKSFRELLPVLTNKQLPATTRGQVYNSCVRSVMLYGSETWAATASTVKRLQRNDRAMVRWMCLVKPEDDTNFETLLSQLKIKDITDVLQLGRLRWLGRVERSTSWISQVRGLSIPTKRSQSSPGTNLWRVTVWPWRWTVPIHKIARHGEEDFALDRQTGPTLI